MNYTNPQHIVGLDIGGTSVVAGVISSQDGHIVSRAKMPTDSKNGHEDGLRRIAALINSVINDANLQVTKIGGIGVGSTGPVDPVTGQIHNPYTLPGWEALPLLDYLNEQFHLPSILLGDCDVAALGEYWAGAGQGSRHIVYVTVGTGIGGAIIIEGRLHRGVALAMSEPGHHVIDLNGPPCYCGARGCWEMLAAAPAIERRAQEAVKGSPDALLLKLADGDPTKITAELVSKAHEQGDPLASEINRQTAIYLGAGVANLMNILTPEIIILGGGVMQSWSLLYSTMMETINARKAMIPLDQMRVLPAKLGLNAGVTGAARAMLDHLQGKL